MDNKADQTAISEVSTLLVLRHCTNSVGIVQSVDQKGNLIDLKPDDNGADTMMRIDSSADSFMEFYSDFYHQLKNPSEYSFFKVTEFESMEAAGDLQSYIDVSSSIEKENLKQYEVSIDTVEALRNEKKQGRNGAGGTNSFYSCSSSTAYNHKYRFQVEDVDWGVMAEIGLSKKQLEKTGALDSLLRGYKTPMLIAITDGDGKVGNTVEARLQLRLDDNGEVVVHVHRVQKMPDFRKRFLGHRFSKEDRLSLLNCGNMGRVVVLVNPVTGEITPSLVSIDKLTHELFSLRMDFVRIPKIICGVELSFEQREVLRNGKPLFIKNMLSRSKKHFSATLQFNAEKQWVEFFFNTKVNSDCSFNLDVPTIFRGKYLRNWQINKLKAGEWVYISGLISEMGKKYQGYIRFDKEVGRIVFSFNKPI